MGVVDIVKGILVVLHIIGFAAIFGSALAQLPNLKRGTAVITNGILHGLITMFVTGIVLVGMLYMLDEPVNNMKITVKMGVLIVLTVVVLIFRKRDKVPGGVIGAIAGLSALNVALAVLWS